MIMRVADYIIKYLIDYGVKDVFMIPGGGAMYLNDALGRNKKIAYICNHHEQASAIAAEGYSKMSGKLAVVIVTSGPGCTNTLTGVIGQWLDSVPVLYLSGQVKFETTILSHPNLKLRQLGDQEINIVDIVKPVTKFSAMIIDAKDVKKKLYKAIYLATHGRPGPVWIDIPLNIQGALINENELYEADFFDDKTEKIDKKIQDVKNLLKHSKRPIIIAGHGIRISGAVNDFLNLVKFTKIPVVTSFLGCDIIPSDNPYFIGRIGTIGNRPGNFALQNSDLLICIGTRNNIRQISYNWDWYAREAKKIVVDIDQAELKKTTIKPDIAICSDAKIFIKKLNKAIKNIKLPNWNDWHKWNIKRKNKYPAYLAEYKKPKNFVHPYYLLHELTQLLRKNDIVVTANATPSVVYYQLGIVKLNQRVIWNSGCASMGYGLPSAIGCAFASKKMRNIICLEGDGSLQMNIQELQTMKHHNLPIKLFIFDNNCYISIKQTQTALFERNFVGIDSKSGISFPNFTKVVKAYDLPVIVIDSHKNLIKKLKMVLSSKGPMVCHVKLTNNYFFSPKTSSKKMPDGKIVSKPLEDMYPFLERKEFLKNMIIPTINE